MKNTITSLSPGKKLLGTMSSGTGFRIITVINQSFKNNKNTFGFTLVELIVVITILVILGTITFISLSGYSKEARDSKRITDANSLLGKVNVEMTKGDYMLKELITNTTKTNLKILGEDNLNVETFGKAHFDNLKERDKNFKDPLDKTRDYPMAYAIGGTGSGAYKFIQVATISEKENKTRIFGNYYTVKEDDAPSLFMTGGIIFEDGDEDLVYNPDKNGNGGGNSGGENEEDWLGANCSTDNMYYADNGSGVCESLFLYTIDGNGKLTITGYKRPIPQDITFKIPGEIFGKEVIGVGGSGFQGKTFKKLVLPNSLQFVKYPGFFQATINGDFYLGENINLLAYGSFNETTFNGDVTFNSNFFESSSTYASFQEAKFNKNVIFGEKFKVIPDGFFMNSEFAEKIVFPSTLKEIRLIAFYGVTFKFPLTIPSLDQPIDDQTFQEAVFEDDVIIYANIGDGEFSGDGPFTDAEFKGDVLIKSSVTYIGNYGFEDIISRGNFTIEEGLTTLGFVSFGGATFKEDFILPSSVSTIKQFSFDGTTFEKNLTRKSSLASHFSSATVGGATIDL